MFGKSYMKVMSRVERFAARRQGKGWGSHTCEHEVRALQKSLKTHGRGDPQVILDVGANVGHWSSAAIDLFPASRFFLFEPSRTNVERLEQRFGCSQATIMPCALSDREGTAILFSDTEGSGLASLQRRQLEHFGLDHQPTYEVRTTTLNLFMKGEALERIDILKLDVEGHELAVLQGASDWLARIGAIQFEFGGCNIDSRTFFRDFWSLLTPRFLIYRITSSHLERIFRYSESDEFFSTTNYIAVNADGRD